MYTITITKASHGYRQTQTMPSLASNLANGTNNTKIEIGYAAKVIFERNTIKFLENGHGSSKDHIHYNAFWFEPKHPPKDIIA